MVSRWETGLTADDHQALSALLVAAFPGQPGVFAGRSWAWARKEARLWLAAATKQAVANTLAILGVSAPESMDRIDASEETSP